MSNIYVEAKRISSESRKIKVSVFEQTSEIHDNSIYRIVRQRLSSSGTTIIKEIVHPFNSTGYTVKVVGDRTIFEFTDSVSKYGSEYIYRVVKEEGLVLVDASLYVSTKTLPSKVDNLKMLNYATDYDKNNIPTAITLAWNLIDVVDNNINTSGYVIYYSLADRGNTNWSAWKPIRGTSTGDTSSIVNVINKSKNTLKVDVPQLTNYLSPKDIKFAIIAITKDTPQLQSRYSNIVSFTMKDVVTALAIKNTISSITLDKTNAYTRPATITTTSLTFDEDAVILLSRADSDPSFGSYAERYTYNLSCNKEIKDTVTISIGIELSYQQKFEVRIFDKDTNKWVQTPATYNMQTKNVNFSLKSLTNFLLLLPKHSVNNKDYVEEMKAKQFADFTNIIISKMPSWSKIRRNPLESIGAHFLNVVGLELDDVKFILNYAYEQTHIGTADLGQADIVYKTSLPKDILESDQVRVVAGDDILTPSSSLEEFLLANVLADLNEEIDYRNKYIIDYEDLVMYVKKPYNADSTHKYGYVNISLTRGIETEHYKLWEANLTLHHIWNFFDEFGMLLNTPRLFGEKNIDYKVRILDVFKNKSNATREGLLNGIARELGIRKIDIWEDVSKDFLIKDPMVTVNMIKVNDMIVPIEYIYFTSDNHIVIKNFSTSLTNNAEVTYVSGLEMHTFHNRNDHGFIQQLYNVDDTATDLFKQYVRIIKDRVPVEWGQFKWNEGYWDIADENMSGIGFLPSILDGKITGFRNYKAK